MNPALIIFIMIFSTSLWSQSVDLIINESKLKITLSDFQAEDILTLYRSNTDLNRIECPNRYYPISSYQLPIKAEVTFIDSLTADNTTYYYKAVLYSNSKVAESKVDSIVVSNLELPDLSSPRFVVDKLNYILEIWDGNKKIKTYPIAMGGNPVKRKLVRDNSSTPEGIYTIYNMQPNATYYKAFDINYPNAVDEARYNYYKQKSLSPFDLETPSIGSEIQIHGNGIGSNWTWGCMAMRDADIKELFSVDNIEAGMKVIIIGDQFIRDDIPFLLSSREIENCKNLQLALKQMKHYIGKIDGLLGVKTSRAIAKFQKANNLPITCDFDKATTAKLVEDREDLN